MPGFRQACRDIGDETLMKHILFRRLSLFSFFGLMFTLLWWILLAPHSENYPTGAVLILLVVPLLFPMRGILYGKPYTHAWAGYLMLFYLAHGITELYSGDAHFIYPLLEIIFSILFFGSSIIYIRLNAKLRDSSQ